MAFATSSLPVPVSPVIRTVASEEARRGILRRTLWNGSLEPTRPSAEKCRWDSASRNANRPASWVRETGGLADKIFSSIAASPTAWLWRSSGNRETSDIRNGARSAQPLQFDRFPGGPDGPDPFHDHPHSREFVRILQRKSRSGRDIASAFERE